MIHRCSSSHYPQRSRSTVTRHPYRSARGILANEVNTDEDSYLLNLKYESFTIFETPLSEAPLSVVRPGRDGSSRTGSDRVGMGRHQKRITFCSMNHIVKSIFHELWCCSVFPYNWKIKLSSARYLYKKYIKRDWILFSTGLTPV